MQNTFPTSEPGPARLLDVTRLVRRIGRPVLTGIDRVEKVWLEDLLRRPEPLSLLLGRNVLSRAAGQLILDWLVAPPAPLGLIERVIAHRHGPAGLARRRLARGGGTIAQALPQGGWYLNLGHLNAEVLPEIGRLRGVRRALFLHDTIPLDHPEWSEPHAVTQLRDLIARGNAEAERVIANSAATREDLIRHGLTTRVTVSWLGADPVVPGALPIGLDPARPWFVALGTIEPRKDHALLLDLWQHLRRAPPLGGLPQLLILGRRGWRGAGLFPRLDACRADPGSGVIEIGDLPDQGVAAALAGAAALLMPSRAEGFGLPVLEAAALGCPVIAAPLPVYKELRCQSVVYAPTGDLYAWKARITEAMARGVAGAEDRIFCPVPDWKSHINTVLADLS